VPGAAVVVFVIWFHISFFVFFIWLGAVAGDSGRLIAPSLSMARNSLSVAGQGFLDF
jgi:hypothetical protein